MALLYYLVVALFILGINAEVRLNYTEVQRFGNSCPQLDSCEYQRSSGRRALVSIKDTNCACDYLCHQYGDCCIDAPKLEVREDLSEFNCYDLKQYGGVYMIDTCLPSYEGPDDVRYQCESILLGDLNDPIGSIPVTDSVTGETFKNYYCSICNYKSENVVLWVPRLECLTVNLFESAKNMTREFVFDNLASYGNSWGLYLSGENGSLFFHDCDVDPVMPPLLESKIRLCKPDLISDCPTDWKDEDVKALCTTYMGARFVHGGDKYRNAHCAICNGVNVTHLSCKSAELREFNIFRQFEAQAFSLLLDINYSKGKTVGVLDSCMNGEIYDPFFKICRSLTCLLGYTRRGEECVVKGLPIEDDTFLSGSGEGPLVTVDSALIGINPKREELHSNLQYQPVADLLQNGSMQFDKGSNKSYNLSNMEPDSPLKTEINKLQSCLLISLTEGEYEMLPNNTIYVEKYNTTYEPTSYYAIDGSILICSHLTEERKGKFLSFMGYATVVGIGISMICLFLHLIIFFLVPGLRNLSGKNLASQCIALLIGYTSFLVGSIDTLGFIGCTVISFLTYYCFLVSFFWLIVMAFDLFRSLKMSTKQLRLNNGKQIKRFVWYSITSWICPLFIIAMAATAEYTDLFPMDFRPGFASPLCWFKRKIALLLFFAGPLIAIMATNIILFGLSARMLWMARNTPFKLQNQANRQSFTLYLRLFLLMGLTWISGFIATAIDEPISWCIFLFSNTLQGLFIFIAFSCTSKVSGYFKAKGLLLDSKSATESASADSTTSTSISSSFTQRLSSRFLLRNKNTASLKSSRSDGSVRKVTPLF